MKYIHKVVLLFSGLIPVFAQAQMAITSEEWDTRNVQRGASVAVKDSYEVQEIDVNAVIKDQVAEVMVTQTIYNPNSTSLEVEIFFPLPNGGIVQNFMLMVNGQELPGKLLTSTEARGIYEGIVRRKKDPALMEYAGYGLFKTSVFPIPTGEQRKITVRYTQLLDKYTDVVNFAYPFGTQKFSSKPLKSVSLTAKISAKDEIKNIFSPTDEVKIDWNGKKEAVVKFEKSYYLPSQDFKMNFSVSNANVGTSLLSYWPKEEKNGYFMLMCSPGMQDNDQKPISKNIVFVLDRSGSMAGKKIEQAKNALQFVLKNLNEGDLFNVVVYDDRVDTYKPEMQRYTKESLTEALSFVTNIQPGGGTNIHDALVKGMEFITDAQKPNYIMFLTDGLPTAGKTGENEIASAVSAANKQNARIFAFGVGDDVNSRLIDRLTTASNGLSVYVKPNEDIEAPVASLYSSISSPVLTNIKVKIDNTDISQTYPEKMPDIFKGGQLVWVGKYTKSGKVKVTVTGNYKGEEKKFELEQTLYGPEDGTTYDYVEKIWASRRVAYLLNQIDLNGRNNELVNDLVAVSKKYGILTPYTSFIALENTELNETQLRSQTIDNLDNNIKKVSGSSANAQRTYKAKEAAKVTTESVAEAVDYDGNVTEVKTVQKVANKTFYYKNNQWLDESLSAEKATDTAKNEKQITIKRFSKEYFELSKKNDSEVNQYLSMSGNVKFSYQGNVYNVVE